MSIISDFQEAKKVLQQGGVLAYPTEAVYGLGCDPFNQRAVERIITLKGRGAEKGFILLISDWSQLFPLIKPLTEEQLSAVRASWPGFTTWIFPASNHVPKWLTGGKSTLAARMSAHPIAKALCADFPITSTSANISGLPPIQDVDTLLSQFSKGIDALVAGELGSYSQPSSIFDVKTGLKIR